MTVSEIIAKYYANEIDFETAKAEVKKLKYFGSLGYNSMLTENEKLQTVVEPEKGICMGWALVNHGVGDMDKMQVRHWRLVHSMGTDVDTSIYTAYMGGYTFKIMNGDMLVIK